MAIGLNTEGSWVAANATTQTVTLPTHATGDMLIVRVGMKHATLPGDITCATAGWARIDQHNNGTTASGNGSGDVQIAAFWKVATSAAETNPVITFHASVAATPSCAVATSFTKGGGEIWVTPAGDSGSIAAATNYSATMGSHIAVAAGDWCVGFAVTNDNTTLTVPTVTQTGVTFAAVVESPAAALSSATSNDIAADGCYRVASSGTSSAAAVFTGTNSVADVGAAMVIRLRAETANPQTVTPTTAALTVTENAPVIKHTIVVPVAGGGADYPTVVTADGPLAYYRMGEASGSVLDSIGSADGTITGSVTRDATGLITSGDDGAIDFAGGGYLEFAWPSSIAQVWTIELWLAVYSSTGFKTFFSSADLYFTINATNGQITAAQTSNVAVTTATGVATVGTHHFVWSRSGITPSTNKLYVDGADVSVDAPGNSSVADTATTIRVGEYIDGSESFLGVIDEIAIYDYALSLADAQAHYAAASAAGGLSLTTFAPTVTVAAGGNVTVTPTTAALVATKYAPTIKFSITPPTKALTLSTFAPVVKLVVIPATTSVVLATFAPSVAVSDHQRVTPTTAALVTAAFVPTVTATDPQLVTPSIVSLTLTAFAPSVGNPLLVTPTTATLTTAAFAPTISVPVLATPTTASLATASFAPTVTASDHQAVVPTTATLAAAAFAPTVTVTAAPVIVPAASLTLATFAPTISTTAHQTVVPTTAALTITEQDAVVSFSAHQTVTPTTAALVLSAQVPTVSATAHQTVTVPNASLTLTTYEPSTTQTDDQVAIPTTKVLTLQTFAPTVTTPNPQLVTPITATLTITELAPTVSTPVQVTPIATALTITRFAPAVRTPILATPTTKVLTLAAFQPSVGSPVQVVPPKATLTVTRFAPTVSATAHQTLVPTTKALTLTTYAPLARVAYRFTPSTASLVLGTFAPTVSATQNVLARPDTASLVITRYAPNIPLTGHQYLEPLTAALILATFVPSVEVHSTTPLPRIVGGMVVVARGPAATVAVSGRGSTTVVVARRPSARVSR